MAARGLTLDGFDRGVLLAVALECLRIMDGRKRVLTHALPDHSNPVVHHGLGFLVVQPGRSKAVLEIAALVEPREFPRHVRRHVEPFRVEVGQIVDHRGFLGLLDLQGQLVRDGQREIALAFDDVAAVLGDEPTLPADVIGQRLLGLPFDVIQRLSGLVE